MRFIGSAVLATLLGARAAGPGPTDGGEPAAPTAASEPAPEPEAEAGPGTPPLPAAVSTTDLVDRVLPCGLRVMIARDTSLPVAAVVLAIETGSEDDPEGQPGLVHALAYQVLQGNRDIRPHGAAGLVHDAGGLATMAFGPGQIRYEALAPAPLLDDLLHLESIRLRAVSVTPELWQQALALARRDPPRRWPVAPAARAAAHGASGLEHEGRRAPPELDQLPAGAVGVQLADRLTYRHATLGVVSPEDPAKVLARVEKLMSDLPEATRQLPPRPVASRGGEVSVPREPGNRLALAVPGNPASIERARTLCRAFNRQRPPSGENRRALIRCAYVEDPRRALLVFRSGIPDQTRALFEARLESLLTGTDRGLLDRQRQIVLDALDTRNAQPLPLARTLVGAEPAPQATIARASGRDALLDLDTVARGIREDFRPDQAVMLVASEGGK